MAGLDGFNAAEVEPNEASEYSLIPNGKYRCGIMACDRKTTRAGTGEYVAVKMQILEGEHENRYVFDNINFINPNATAQQIGRAQLSSLCRAVGIMTPNDTSEFVNKIVEVNISLRKNKKTGENYNRVDYITGSAAASTPAAQAPAQSTAGPGGVWTD